MSIADNKVVFLSYRTPLYSDPRWPALLHQVGLADDQLK
ncbi:MAG: hypothetical protein JWQ62_3058 [Lacunisphaera sp.]|nr:hypothetical protein [Lacunisphaera sp.]